MCVNPSTLPTGHVVGCSKCWQCHEVRIQDWVGRCIAESKTCEQTYSLTLTYGGGDHERATVLTYSDVQKYFKRLRKAGYRFKYLVAGEFGGTKGRAHWHLMLFFKGKAPPHELDRRFSCPFWPHGWSWWERPHPKSVRYVCKYIQKDMGDDERQGHFAMSKKPPIGHEYFMRLADQHVRERVPPRDLKYQFDDNRDKHGKPVQHLMQGAIARDFLDSFIDGWEAAYPGETIPTSKPSPGIGREHLSNLASPVERHLAQRQGVHLPPSFNIRTLDVPDWLPFEGFEYQADHVRCRYYGTHEGVRYEWKKHEGQYQWVSVKGPVDRRATTVYELDIWKRLAAITREQREREIRRARLDPLRLENYVSGRISLPKIPKRWTLPMVGETRRPR